MRLRNGLTSDTEREEWEEDERCRLEIWKNKKQEVNSDKGDSFLSPQTIHTTITPWKNSEGVYTRSYHHTP